MKTKDITVSAMFIAIGVFSSNLIYIPIGASKCFPIQHAINVLSAVMLGPAYAVINAFCISLIRNFIGTGSLLAFPGSMIGALIAGIAYKYTDKKIFALVGEVFGTGILGGFLAIPIATIFMGAKVGAFVYIIPFVISSSGGAVIAYLLLKSKEVLNTFERKEV